MKPRIRLSRFLIPAAFFSGILLHAQSSPELQEILNRLEKLEQANRALVEEVRSLHQELAEARTSAPATPAAQTQDQIDVTQARVEEMAQSKVESSQKLPLRVTGMALFNMYSNSANNAGTENTTIASLTRGDASGGGTLRQTVLGLQYDSPQSVFGAKVSGSIYADFFGGSAASLDHLVRLRTATISLDWTDTSLSFGQDKPLISARDPNSFAQVGVSPLTDAGNLWLWLPQLRVEQRFHFGNNAGLRAQIGVVQTRQIGDESNGYNSYLPPPTGITLPVERPEPGVEGRLLFWKQWGENTRVEIAPGFHENPSTVGSANVNSHLYSFDWLIKPVSHLEFTGFFYQGQNVANLGALPQGFAYKRYTGTIPIPSVGGWAQIRIPVTERLAFDFYGGRQDDQNSDLPRGYIGLNQAFAANAMYRVAPNVIFSLEAGQVRTNYIDTGSRLDNHYDLAVAYLF